MSLNPPRPSLPPLNALRAFESAARLGGFKYAAEELNVTSGAVAQHIKLLEAWCGGALFERRAQGVSLTPLGHSVLPDFVAAFDAISFASQRLRTQAAPNTVSVAALPSIAQLLIAQWLPRLRAVVKDVQISVTALEVAPNLAREPYDLSLFFASKPQGRMTNEDQLVPVCAPALADMCGTLDGLMSATHISDQSWVDDWRIWFRAHWPNRVYSGQGPSYSLFSVAVQECTNGAGVLMAHRSLVAPLLERGALVVAMDHVAPTGLFLDLQRSPVTGQSTVIDRLSAEIESLASD